MSDLSFSSTLYGCACECAYRRRTKSCKFRFDSAQCYDCPWYIKKYIDADPRHAELFMIKAESRAQAVQRASHRHHGNFILAILIFLALAAWFYHLDVKSEAWAAERHATVNSVVQKKEQPKVNTEVDMHSAISTTLYKVADDLNKRIDVNNDGLINCIDAAVKFYQYFPYKDRVCIELNYNEGNGFNHLFNCVYMNGNWRAIEPQAYWKHNSVYFMRDIWGSQYDSSKNEDVTNDYMRYVK